MVLPENKERAGLETLAPFLSQLGVTVDNLISTVEERGSSHFILHNESVYYCDPSSKRLEYKGQLKHGKIIPQGTYHGVAQLLEVRSSYAITIIPEIVDEAKQQCTELRVHLYPKEKELAPNFSAFIGRGDEEQMANQLITAYGLAAELDYKVQISGPDWMIFSGH